MVVRVHDAQPLVQRSLGLSVLAHTDVLGDCPRPRAFWRIFHAAQYEHPVGLPTHAHTLVLPRVEFLRVDHVRRNELGELVRMLHGDNSPFVTQRLRQ